MSDHVAHGVAAVIQLIGKLGMIFQHPVFHRRDLPAILQNDLFSHPVEETLHDLVLLVLAEPAAAMQQNEQRRPLPGAALGPVQIQLHLMPLDGLVYDILQTFHTVKKILSDHG